MSKKYTLLATIFVLVLVGVAVFVMTRKPETKMEPENKQTSSAQEKTTQPKEGPQTLMDIVSLGISQKCTYKDTTDSVSIEGTAYVSGGKVRGDFKSSFDGNVTNGHMIYDGKTDYFWNEGDKTGYMMDISKITPAQGNTETSTQPGNDMNKAINYHCSAWIPTDSVFTPPSDVEFKSFTIPTATQGDAMTGNKNLCDTCSSLTGDQKTQCLKALSCE